MRVIIPSCFLDVFHVKKIRRIFCDIGALARLQYSRPMPHMNARQGMKMEIEPFGFIGRL